MPRTPKMLSNANLTVLYLSQCHLGAQKTTVVESIIAQEIQERAEHLEEERKNLMDLDFHSDTRCFITFVSKAL